MDNKPRQKQKDSSWNDQNENDRLTNPNRRQEEDSENVDTSRDQRASKGDPGSSESTPSRGDEQLHRDRGSSGRRESTSE